MTIVEPQSGRERPSIWNERSGSGPAKVMLIHGIGSSGADFTRLVSCLDSGSSTVAPDLRGHGKSEASLPVTVEGFAADLLPLIDEEGPMVLAGFSFGSRVAMEIWRKRPEGVSALVLVDPPLVYGPLFEWASRGGSGRHRLRHCLKKAAGISGLGLSSLRRLGARWSREEALARISAIYYSADVDEAVELMRENPLTRDLDEADLLTNARSLMAADRATLLATLELTGESEGQTRPPGASIEPVVMFGDRSPMTDPDAAGAFAARIGGRAVSYSGGQVAHQEAPEEVAEEIERLLPGED